MSLLWRGFDANGDRLILVEAQVRERYPRALGRYYHEGRLRLACSAEEAQRHGWPDVAAMFSGENQAMLVSRFHTRRTS